MTKGLRLTLLYRTLLIKSGVKDGYYKYPIPSNCDKLCVLQVNLPVWKRLNHFVRTKDIRISNIQCTCVAAGAALACGLHSLVTSDSVQTEPLIRCLTDALVMMGHVNYDLSLVRHDRMNLPVDYKMKMENFGNTVLKNV